MKTGSDKADFYCVWKGNWYRLASLSVHIKEGVPKGKYLLLDGMYRHYLAPKTEVHIAHLT